MRKITKSILLLTSAVCLSSSQLSAVETDPVGYVTFTVGSNADTKFSPTLLQAPIISAAVADVVNGTVSTDATIGDLTATPHFLWVTSGSLTGQWFEITSSTQNSVLVSEDLQAEGLSSADLFSVIPFWTLDTLFPAGGDIPTSPSTSNINASIFINNVSGIGTNLAASAEYVYFDDGPGGVPNGWYNINNPSLGSQGNLVISPETYITVRNNTLSEFAIVTPGTVPVNPISTSIVSYGANAQDNQVSNLYPQGITLGASGLISSGAVTPTSNPSNPNRDGLFVFPEKPSAQNPAASVEFVYIDDGAGGVPDGWYDINNPGLGVQDSYVIPSGAALIIRKGASENATTKWIPPTPYNL